MWACSRTKFFNLKMLAKICTKKALITIGYSISQEASAYGGLRPPDPLTRFILHRIFLHIAYILFNTNLFMYVGNWTWSRTVLSFILNIRFKCAPKWMVSDSIFLNVLGRVSAPPQTLPRFTRVFDRLWLCPWFSGKTSKLIKRQNSYQHLSILWIVYKNAPFWIRNLKKNSQFREGTPSNRNPSSSPNSGVFRVSQKWPIVLWPLLSRRGPDHVFLFFLWPKLLQKQLVAEFLFK